MKKQLVFVLALAASFTTHAARQHNLQTNGMAARLKMLGAEPKTRKNLPAIVQKYYARVQQGNYDIPFDELQKLYEAMSALSSADKINLY